MLAGAVVLPLGLFDCPFRTALGIPCLTCGCTRAFHFAVRGQLGAALEANPLGTLLAALCAVHLVWTAARLCGFPYALEMKFPRRAALLAVAANWAFVALRS